MARLVSHTAAKYGPGTDAEHCSICVMYRKDCPTCPSYCTKVVQPIEPYAHCRYFSPKEKSDAARK